MPANNPLIAFADESLGLDFLRVLAFNYTCALAHLRDTAGIDSAIRREFRQAAAARAWIGYVAHNQQGVTGAHIEHNSHVLASSAFCITQLNGDKSTILAHD